MHPLRAAIAAVHATLEWNGIMPSGDQDRFRQDRFYTAPVVASASLQGFPSLKKSRRTPATRFSWPLGCTFSHQWGPPQHFSEDIRCHGRRLMQFARCISVPRYVHVCRAQGFWGAEGVQVSSGGRDGTVLRTRQEGFGLERGT
jgi:hypothetical protein